MPMNDNTKIKLKEIINSDSLGLLEEEPILHGQRTLEEQRLIDSFQEICDFYEENNRIPSTDGDLGEYLLSQRLVGIKGDAKKVKILIPFDMYNLLEAEKATSITIDEILQEDPLGLLNGDSDGEIFKLTHIKPTDRIRPDYISHRRVCQDFDKYEQGFNIIYQDLETGRRKLVEYKRGTLLDNHYYVLRGVTFLLQLETLKVDPKTYESGTYNRLDGRTRCIFDNGTESNMLYRSLEKAMNLDGFCISEPVEIITKETIITDDDVQNGYIYVLKSKSQNPAIKSIKDLYKIGYCAGSVTERVKNAKNEPTYLMSDITIIMTARCFNMNARYLESVIHGFFGDVNIAFEVKDRNGEIHYPREWFTVPLTIIEEAIKLIVNNEADGYKYDATVGKIVKKA